LQVWSMGAAMSSRAMLASITIEDSVSPTFSPERSAPLRPAAMASRSSSSSNSSQEVRASAAVAAGRVAEASTRGRGAKCTASATTTRRVEGAPPAGRRSSRKAPPAEAPRARDRRPEEARGGGTREQQGTRQLRRGHQRSEHGASSGGTGGHEERRAVERSRSDREQRNLDPSRRQVLLEDAPRARDRSPSRRRGGGSGSAEGSAPRSDRVQRTVVVRQPSPEGSASAPRRRKPRGSRGSGRGYHQQQHELDHGMHLDLEDSQAEPPWRRAQASASASSEVQEAQPFLSSLPPGTIVYVVPR